MQFPVNTPLVAELWEPPTPQVKHVPRRNQQREDAVLTGMSLTVSQARGSHLVMDRKSGNVSLPREEHANEGASAVQWTQRHLLRLPQELGQTDILAPTHHPESPRPTPPFI